MEASWYTKCPNGDANLTRVDFRISRTHRRNLIRRRAFAKALAEYLKTQRLLPDEIDKCNKALEAKTKLDAKFRENIKLAFAEGILKDDLFTVDDDALTGTCGQVVFQWIREEFFEDKIILGLPFVVTGSSKEKGIDRFEILGDPNNYASLYFIVWEVKATDFEVNSRTDEIYQMHKKRSPRLLRGVQMTLSLEYPRDKYPVLGEFVRHLMDDWLTNAPTKRIGGAVIFDTTKYPGNVFTTFHVQFPDLFSAECRQVMLIEVPQFKKTRKKLWKHLADQIS